MRDEGHIARAAKRGGEDLLVRAFQALLEIAVTFSREDGTVLISSHPLPDSRTIVVDSDGGTIPGPALTKFFGLFSMDDVIIPDADIGLGAAVAYRILSLFGSSVRVANRDERGIRLTVSLKNCLAVCNASPELIRGKSKTFEMLSELGQ